MAGYITGTVDQGLFDTYAQGRARASALYPNTFVGGQWSAVNDGATCDWCGWADTRVFHKGTQPWEPPVHHGCRCLVGWITANEFPPKADWGKGPPKSSFPPGSTNGHKGGKPTQRSSGKTPKPKAHINDTAAKKAGREWKQLSKGMSDQPATVSLWKRWHENSIKAILGNDFDDRMYEAVRKYIDRWTATSTFNKKKLAGVLSRGSYDDWMKLTTTQRFESFPWVRTKDDFIALTKVWDAEHALNREVMKVSGMLDRDGFTTIYRGTNLKRYNTAAADAVAAGDTEFAIGTGFFDSWSMSQRKAAGFGDYVFKKKIHVDDIWNSWITHPEFRAFPGEREILWFNWDETVVPKAIDWRNGRWDIEVW